jgi:hypothetical protein
MLGIGKDVVKGFVNAFLALPKMIVDIIKTLPALIVDALSGLGGLVAGVLKKVPILGKLFGVGGAVKSAATTVAHALGFGGGKLKGGDVAKILSLDTGDKKLIGTLRGSGMSDADILDYLLKSGNLSKDDFRKLLKKVIGFASGGTVRGVGVGDTVPAMLTPGEWVVNERQKKRLSDLAGLSVGQLQRHLFMRQSLAPRLGYATGGVVMQVDSTQAHTNHVTQHVSITTSSPRVDVDYVSRVLRSRMAQRL